MSSSSWTIRHAGHRLGDHLGARRGRRASGSDTSSQRAGDDPVGLADRARSSVDRAGGGQVGGLGAGEAEQPGERGVDPLALEAVGDGQGRGRQPCRCTPSAPSAPVPCLGACCGARAPSTPMPRSARKPISTAAETMAESATLKIGQCGSCDEVDDVPAAGPGRPDHPVGEVAQGAAEQQAEGPRPPAGCRGGGRGHDHRDDAAGHEREDPRRSRCRSRRPRRGCGSG